ncbi:endolytic transglycosylase MltG [uncultured Pseudokineococcus sp.]|uniref:endolytic transglycosylase MltG n=1 Tax=uncultured Pseudokineococcus sp. TaxID=1642928 RepID=UPI002617E560|nr:endolytic transglycosylase MltG [uncultured Pseudokineococcus sp.]
MSRRSRQPVRPDVPLVGAIADPTAPDPAAEPRRRGGRGVRRAVTAVVLVLALALVAGAGLVGWNFLRPLLDREDAPTDFAGPGTGEVQVQVEQGDTGQAIGETLVEAGVVQSVGAFVSAAAAEPESASIQPGTYALREEMSAAGALDLLLSPAARVDLQVQLIEGLRAEAALAQIAADTGLPVEELRAAGSDPAVTLPAEAEGNLEGYLFPATYTFEPDVTPVEVIATMVSRAEQGLVEGGIPPERWHRTMTVASLVEAEASREEDRPRVARVIENRVGIDMPLQFDTTVDYATGKRGVTTTDEDRATDSPYNTYVYPGLPPGPINSPGDSAIAAASAPAEGPWLYFVAVDPSTGETRFAETFEEHSVNVRLFQQWLRDNPSD